MTPVPPFPVSVQTSFQSQVRARHCHRAAHTLHAYKENKTFITLDTESLQAEDISYILILAQL